ncbi:FadR/GntR family transcriptional regulator [Streptomyces tsukubensis]|uniref:GntR family transcriptional regulator n=1 Tax=Streptomyces tsukubensis TaxID=83656 RepID=A0A1V3ZZG5_9ACTN|nr:FCD domain-containing protein [Streptomyces tsukubensis]OON71851.1 GntR family transcriptional regulator [Streptomyces tsukubensis]QFR93673.1 FCD domain-containing protein [Streptomyces tsukubensis]
MNDISAPRTPRTPRRTASLSAQLVDSLRSHIETGGWPVGTRIPPEQTLIEELGVGRSTLREALGALVHLGMLEARVGDGTYVRASSELQSVMVRRASSAQRDNVLELRTVLEEYASGTAALRRSEEQLGQLRELLADADEAAIGEDLSAARSVDALFHRAVVRASGNDLLIEVYDYLGTALTSSLGGLPWDAEGAEEHAHLHTRLVNAIEAKDQSGARTAAAAIVQLTRDHETETPRPTDGRQ